MLSTILAPCAFTQDNGMAFAPTTASRQIIVSIPDRKLVVMQNGAVLREFPIAVGATVSPSPTGTFEIVNRLSDPTYYHAGVVLPPGADNPLGPRWVGLSKKGYGIHGTNAPGSIGKAASHGCIRLRNRDMVQLFALVHVGDTVEIHGERDQEIAGIFGNDANAPVDMPASGGAAGGQ
jgi:lipoprotein-anchoring transpeptidase ErfK/SrfK